MYMYNMCNNCRQVVGSIIGDNLFLTNVSPTRNQMKRTFRTQLIYL